MLFGKKKTHKKDKTGKKTLLTDEEQANPSDGLQQPDYEKPRPRGITRFCKVRYYQKFFNVSTKEVVRRVLLAMMPFNTTPIFPNGKPDLYGPLWIYICLSICIVICGHFSNVMDFEFIDNHPPKLQYEAQMRKITKLWFMTSFYFFVVPLIIHGICFFFGSGSPGYQRTLAIYGYSFAIFIPATVILVPPIEYLRYATLGVAGFISLLFISKELMDAGKKYLEQKWVTAIAIM
mmetsp:Transcript_19351/g.19038  ORF Transcript_19351/g.19038 Transcript_19351/m.19038 type:complete len:234 (-) Transcript_19351:25-726(-)